MTGMKLNERINHRFNSRDTAMSTETCELRIC